MHNRKTIAFHTLGCKLNYAETSTLSRRVADAGFSPVSFNDAADVYVINTCSVTEQADKKCRQVVRRALRKNKDAYVVVVGCYAQLKPREISEIPGVDVVLGAAEKFRLVEYLSDLTKTEKGTFYSCEIDDVNGFNTSYSYGSRTRTFLKVQDGCDYTCTFCTIPLARGRSRSGSIEEVLSNAREIAQTDVKEIVLTGVNIGDFGKGPYGGKTPEQSFLDLIKQLDKVEGIERFRISSIEPNLLNDDIIEFVAGSRRFVPHFHVPLQSGSNNILGKMRRRYKRELYAQRVSKIKELMPHCCIGVDVIVGFPGETEAHFMETYHFLKDIDISYLHVFTYSERENTLAATMDEPVPVHLRNERNKKLQILSEKKRKAFYDLFTGTSRPVLFETENNDGRILGFTDNYIRVELPFDETLTNQIVEIELTEHPASSHLTGQVLETTCNGAVT